MTVASEGSAKNANDGRADHQPVAARTIVVSGTSGSVPGALLCLARKLPDGSADHQPVAARTIVVSGTSGSVPGVPLCPAKKLLRPPANAALSQPASTPSPPAIGRLAASARVLEEESIGVKKWLLSSIGSENAQFVLLVHLEFL